MRLIDADALIEDLKGSLFYSDSIPFVEEAPTAYDVEKVVEQLEKLKQHNKNLSEGAYLEDDKSFYFCAYTNFERAIGIVRNGRGMNDFTITERKEPFTLEEVFAFIDDTSIGKMDAYELKSRIADVVQAERNDAINKFKNDLIESLEELNKIPHSKDKKQC